MVTDILRHSKIMLIRKHPHLTRSSFNWNFQLSPQPPPPQNCYSYFNFAISWIINYDLNLKSLMFKVSNIMTNEELMPFLILLYSMLTFRREANSSSGSFLFTKTTSTLTSTLKQRYFDVYQIFSRRGWMKRYNYSATCIDTMVKLLIK